MKLSYVARVIHWPSTLSPLEHRYVALTGVTLQCCGPGVARESCPSPDFQYKKSIYLASYDPDEDFLKSSVHMPEITWGILHFCLNSRMTCLCVFFYLMLILYGGSIIGV